MKKIIIFIIAAIIVFSWLIANSTTKPEKSFLLLCYSLPNLIGQENVVLAQSQLLSMLNKI